jgi:hypothetical protein
MASAAKEVNGKAFTTPSGDVGGGAREAASSKGPSGAYKEQTGPSPNGREGWTGGYSDTDWLGNPANIKDRQFASEGGKAYNDPVNIAWPVNEVEADIYMVPDFQEASGQGANQSTLRPIGST